MAEHILLNLQAESTKRAYKKYADDYERSRAGAAHSEAALLAFIVKESESKAPTTLWTIYSLVKKYLALECSVDIGRSARITEFIKTLGRQHKKKKANAFSRDQLFEYLRGAPSEGRSLIVKLVLLVGFYGGLRCCEIVALTWEDINFAQEGILVNIARSKTDRAGVGAVKLLPKLDDEAICPVYYFGKYKNSVKQQIGRLFCQYHNGKFTKAPLGKTSIASMPMEVAAFLGLEDSEGYTGHALRATSATVLADEGANNLTLKRHGRWASDNVAEGYIRESKSVRKETAALLAGSSSITLIEKQLPSNPPVSITNVFTNCVFNSQLILQGELEQKQ